MTKAKLKKTIKHVSNNKDYVIVIVFVLVAATVGTLRVTHSLHTEASQPAKTQPSSQTTHKNTQSSTDFTDPTLNTKPTAPLLLPLLLHLVILIHLHLLLAKLIKMSYKTMLE
jgi:hypothetical protein